MHLSQFLRMTLNLGSGEKLLNVTLVVLLTVSGLGLRSCLFVCLRVKPHFSCSRLSPKFQPLHAITRLIGPINRISIYVLMVFAVCLEFHGVFQCNLCVRSRVMAEVAKSMNDARDSAERETGRTLIMESGDCNNSC